MMHYKSPDGKLHWLDSENDEIRLPPGSLKITNEEAELIRNPPMSIERIIEEIIKLLEKNVQERLDTFARSVNFDSLIHACLTGLQPVGTYRQSDGEQFIQLRYETWQKAAEIRDAFLAGERSEPTWDEVETELPSYPII